MQPAAALKPPLFFGANEPDFAPAKPTVFVKREDWDGPVSLPPVVESCGAREQAVVPMIPLKMPDGRVVLIPLAYEDIVIDDEQPHAEVKVEAHEGAAKYHSLYRVILTHDFVSREPVLARGLYNTRNRCFFNAMLQVLVHCTPLYSLLENIYANARQPAAESPILGQLVEFAHNYGHVGDTKRAFDADRLYDVVCAHASFNIERDRQEDAQEFLGNLLDTLESIFSSAQPREEDDRDVALQLRKKARGLAEASKQSEDDWVEVGQNHKPIETQHAGHQDLENPIQALFGGRFQSTLLKSGSKKASITTEPFSQIPLDISADAVYSIQTAFSNMLAVEELMLDTTSATKTIRFQRVPPVLVANLKRFTVQMTNGTFQYGKINKRIEIDPVLQVACGMDTFSYEPFGIVYHHGSRPETGHYTADVKVGEQWYRIDDEQVVPLAEHKVLGGSTSEPGSGSAYIVVYILTEQVQ